MNDAVFHFCAMGWTLQGEMVYVDEIVRVQRGGTVDIEGMRARAAEMAAAKGLQLRTLPMVLLSVTRLSD